MNDEILSVFDGFTVENETIPVRLISFNAKKQGYNGSYVVFSREDDSDALSADDQLECWATYYDFDVYSKHGCTTIAQAVRGKLETAGWTWQPSRSKFDMYERDTGYYHVTLNFSKERS